MGWDSKRRLNVLLQHLTRPPDQLLHAGRNLSQDLDGLVPPGLKRDDLDGQRPAAVGHERLALPLAQRLLVRVDGLGGGAEAAEAEVLDVLDVLVHDRVEPVHLVPSALRPAGAATQLRDLGQGHALVRRRGRVLLLHRLQQVRAGRDARDEPGPERNVLPAGADDVLGAREARAAARDHLAKQHVRQPAAACEAERPGGRRDRGDRDPGRGRGRGRDVDGVVDGKVPAARGGHLRHGAEVRPQHRRWRRAREQLPPVLDAGRVRGAEGVVHKAREGDRLGDGRLARVQGFQLAEDERQADLVVLGVRDAQHEGARCARPAGLRPDEVPLDECSAFGDVAFYVEVAQFVGELLHVGAFGRVVVVELGNHVIDDHAVADVVLRSCKHGTEDLVPLHHLLTHLLQPWHVEPAMVVKVHGFIAHREARNLRAAGDGNRLERARRVHIRDLPWLGKLGLDLVVNEGVDVGDILQKRKGGGGRSTCAGCFSLGLVCGRADDILGDLCHGGKRLGLEDLRHRDLEASRPRLRSKLHSTDGVATELEKAVVGPDPCSVKIQYLRPEVTQAHLFVREQLGSVLNPA
ncbi:hypothetical protein PpBr36_00632 [Pyricularia pennisetigena]|uniref:hypothetical protein n=1 Tax=Pyricularia pennisetigena TaxID=1578925 RepID=UPI00114E90E7|nr:hypothetical protein PpBr36_00632 [Pyricularia pennisetigena]TLS28730.1 hypothetical protein PpBr36_00632 [Pyricularia pennisetigena]